jgi:glycerol kinase
MAVVAVDQGTTSTKSAVLSEEGRLQPAAQHGHRQAHPRDGWVEHDPRELLGNVRRCLDAAAQAGTVDAIGIANQGETVVAWDAASGEPLHPAIVWQDNRTRARVEALKAEGAEELTLATAGLPLDPYFSATKIAWLLEEVPEVAERARSGQLRIGTTDSYFLHQLTGRYVTDVTTASRTSLLNVRTGAWDPQLCELFGVPVELLAEVLPTTGDFGELSLAGGSSPVRASVVDQQAALYGHGCRSRGDTKATFGTGAFVLTVYGEDYPDDVEGGLLPTVAWALEEGRRVYALDGGVYDAGSAVDWAGRLGLFSDLDDLGALPFEPVVERGLTFVPALSGLACPHWDRSAAGTWLGMTHGTTPLALAQSVLEGVALLTADVVRLMERYAPPSGPLSVDGGLARNPWFCRFLATVVQRPVRAPEGAELTMLGAAHLAAGGEATVLPEAEVYEPHDADPSAWIDTFAQAVTRARGWR